MRDANLRKDASGVYFLRVPQAGTNRRKWVSTGARDIKSAREVVETSGAERLVLLHNARCVTAETIAMVTIGRNIACEEVFELWKEWVKPRVAPSTFAKLVQNVLRLLEHAGLLKKSMQDITETMLREWINDGVSPASTRRGRLFAFRSLFKFASAKGLVVGNPALLVDIDYRTMTVEQIEGKHTEPISEDDYLKILAGPKIPQFFKDATVLSYCTGLRLCDCACFQWGSFTAESLIVYPLKTSRQVKRLTIPLGDPLIARPELRALIARLLTAPKEDPTFVWPVEAATIQSPWRSSLSMRYTRLIRRVGVAQGTFHSLRVAFSRRLKAAGKTLEEISAHMAHSSIEQTAIYTGDSHANSTDQR